MNRFRGDVVFFYTLSSGVGVWCGRVGTSYFIRRFKNIFFCTFLPSKLYDIRAKKLKTVTKHHVFLLESR